MNIIMQASFDARLKSNEARRTTIGTGATLTAFASKDLYLTAAKITFALNNNGATDTTSLAELQINGTPVETAHASLSNRHTSGSSIGAASSVYTYEFRNLAQKVTATQIMKIEIITLDTDTKVETMIQAVEVPAGQNPATYTGN